MKVNPNMIKYISIATTIVGGAATLVSNWAGEQKQKQEIMEEIARQLAELNKK